MGSQGNPWLLFVSSQDNTALIRLLLNGMHRMTYKEATFCILQKKIGINIIRSYFLVHDIV